MRADIEIPSLQVAVDARINRRGDVCLSVAGQHHLFRPAPRLGWITVTVGIAMSRVWLFKSRCGVDSGCDAGGDSVRDGARRAAQSNGDAEPQTDGEPRRRLAVRAHGLRGYSWTGTPGAPGRRQPCSNAKTAGTKVRVATVANSKPADDRAAQRRILLAAFAHAQRHRNHADDHRERRHDYRAEAGEAGVPARHSRGHGIPPASPWRS